MWHARPFASRFLEISIWSLKTIMVQSATEQKGLLKFVRVFVEESTRVGT
jgi:hypothetical protein